MILFTVSCFRELKLTPVVVVDKTVLTKLMEVIKEFSSTKDNPFLKGGGSVTTSARVRPSVDAGGATINDQYSLENSRRRNTDENIPIALHETPVNTSTGSDTKTALPDANKSVAAHSWIPPHLHGLPIHSSQSISSTSDDSKSLDVQHDCSVTESIAKSTSNRITLSESSRSQTWTPRRGYAIGNLDQHFKKSSTTYATGQLDDLKGSDHYELDDGTSPESLIERYALGSRILKQQG
jgi:hypothetical protein